MVDYPDILNFTRDELIDEFCKLFDRYQELRECSEADAQKIHELKRSLDTATAAQTYLSQELEQYTNCDNTQDENELQKTIGELSELRKKYSKLEEAFNALQQDYNTLLDENSALAQNLQEATKRNLCAPVMVESHTSEEDLQRMQMLEHENMELLEKIDEFQEHTVSFTLTIGQYEKNIEILRDQVNCLEENLQSKKAELEEKLQMLESTQEQLSEANAQIAMLSSAPETAERKGNSLFAEVDDQRQVMRKLLAAQKQNYVQMKKIYNESEHEIRRLKRENIAMHKEMETCSSIFCNADKVYQDKLNERLRHLSNQNEELERKLNWTQERLKELASEKGVLWLDSMLSLCKKETDDLKKQLHSVRIQKASLEEQLRNSQQDMVRWRFESLKSRCILLDREQLLNDNNIKFKPIQAIEFRITEKQQNEAKPRIMSGRRSSIIENIKRRSLTPLKVVTNDNKNYADDDQPGLSKKITVENTQQELSNKEQMENKNYADDQQKLSKNIPAENIAQKLISENQDHVINTSAPTTDTKEKFKAECEATNKSTCNIDKTKCATYPAEEELKGTQNFEIYTDDPQEEDKENSISSDICVMSKFSKLEINPPSPMRPSQRASKLDKNQEDISTSPVRSILVKHRDVFSTEECKIVTFSSKQDIIHHLSPTKSSSPIVDSKNSSTVAPSTPLTCNKEVYPKTSSSNFCDKDSQANVKEARTKSNVVVRRIVIGSKHN